MRARWRTEEVEIGVELGQRLVHGLGHAPEVPRVDPNGPRQRLCSAGKLRENEHAWPIAGARTIDFLHGHVFLQSEKKYPKEGEGEGGREGGRERERERGIRHLEQDL